MQLLPHVKACLSEAVAFIRDFESRLAAHHNQPHFDWDNRAYAKRGSLEVPEGEAHYWFHGRGCTLRRDGVVIDYDYARYAAPPEDCPILLSPWKFARTVRSLDERCPVEEVSRKAEEAAWVWLQELERDGLVRKLPDGLASYEVDEVALREQEGAA